WSAAGRRGGGPGNVRAGPDRTRGDGGRAGRAAVRRPRVPVAADGVPGIRRPLRAPRSGRLVRTRHGEGGRRLSRRPARKGRRGADPGVARAGAGAGDRRGALRGVDRLTRAGMDRHLRRGTAAAGRAARADALARAAGVRRRAGGTARAVGGPDPRLRLGGTGVAPDGPGRIPGAPGARAVHGPGFPAIPAAGLAARRHVALPPVPPVDEDGAVTQGPPPDELVTAFHQYLAQTSHEPAGLNVASAEGPWLTDTGGRRYLDWLAGIGVLNLGHRHPAIMQALREQLD